MSVVLPSLSRMTSQQEALLEPRLVGDIAGKFFVPDYQRGYRWGADEVGRLLNDLWEAREKPYYLQPVVVKRRDDEWELVDGQQRLTTLYLLLEYMRREGLQSSGASYTLRYETREDSAAYLDSLDVQRSSDNIDFFHMRQAYDCISRWFDAEPGRRQYKANKLYDSFFESVRVIWYEAPEDLNAVDLFTRLNVGRIPLTEAELVKALLLSRSRTASATINRALEIAAKWDTIERDLRQPELWAFVTAKSSEDPTHIGLLLDILAGGPTGRDRPLFYTFEHLRVEIEADPEAFWDRVDDVYSMILGWHENRDLFHKIGFLVADGAKLSDLIEVSVCKSKSSFESALDGLIRDRLDLTEPQLRELSYTSGRNQTGRTLLLMNVETVRRRQHSAERYSFQENARGRWSLEHIHAQNAEALNRADQWETWLQLHKRTLEGIDAIDDDAKRPVLKAIDEALALPTLRQSDFRPLERDVIQLFSGVEAETGDVDSIGNLALLAGGDNSALSNSVFAVKRSEILRLDREGSYIPLCTRNVFLKYYTPGDQHQLHFWSSEDREHYVAEILTMLAPYLRTEAAS